MNVSFVMKIHCFFLHLARKHLNENTRVASNFKYNCMLQAPSIEAVSPDLEGFLTQHPIDIIRSGDFNKVPWLIGNVGNEGASAAVGTF